MSGSALIFKVFLFQNKIKLPKTVEMYGMGRGVIQGIMLKIMLGWRYNAQIMPD